MTHRFTIFGKPVSQKNSKEMAQNRKTGAWFPVSNSGVKSWHKSALKQLDHEWRRRPALTGKMEIEIRSFVGERQRGDVDNLACAPMDALQKAGVILSDYQIERLVSERLRDRENPRVEITLTTQD